MSDQTDLSIVIPAFNEVGGIGAVLKELKTHVPGAEVIVVDDASSDGTCEAAMAEVAEGFDLVIMRHPFNQGYGSSLTTGMRAASRAYIAWFDADNEHRVEDLLAMVQRMRDERLACIIGERPDSVSSFRAVGKSMIRALTRVFNVPKVRDLNCGLRVFRRDVILNYLPLLPQRYSASLTTTILMLERGYPVAFHPITIAPRMGTSKVRIRDGFLAMAKVMNLITLFAPMRIFFRGGALLTLLGLVYGLIIAISERKGFPVAGLLLIMVGLLLAMQGLIAEQISQMRLSALGAKRPADKVHPLDGPGA